MTPLDSSTPGIPVPHYLPEFAQVHSTESVMPSNQDKHSQGLNLTIREHLLCTSMGKASACQPLTPMNPAVLSGSSFYSHTLPAPSKQIHILQLHQRLKYPQPSLSEGLWKTLLPTHYRRGLWVLLTHVQPCEGHRACATM